MSLFLSQMGPITMSWTYFRQSVFRSAERQNFHIVVRLC